MLRVSTRAENLAQHYASDITHAAAEGASSGRKGPLGRTCINGGTAPLSYDRATKVNAIEQTAKDQDVKCKTQESISSGKAVDGASSVEGAKLALNPCTNIARGAST